MAVAADFQLRVQAMRWEAPHVVGLELRAATGEALPAWTAGSHIDLHLPNGSVRQYSLCGDPADTGHYRLGVLNERQSRGGSRCVHTQLRVGDRIGVSKPRNNFALQESASFSVLVAGGIGVTPILSMARRLAATGGQAAVLYCARSRADAAFVGELQALADGSHGRIGLQLRFDDEHAGPPDLQALLNAQPRDAHIYCCGPAPMLDGFVAAGAALGFANVHIERFAAAEDAAATSADEYTVELAKTGRSLTVPAGRPLLDVLIEAGVNAPFSCRAGVCGTCETPVLAGEVDHRDSILSDAERAANNTMMVCVSGCKRGPLVLGL